MCDPQALITAHDPSPLRNTEFFISSQVFFSVHLSASQILINLSSQHTHEVKMVSPVYRWETKAQRLRTKVTKISTNLDVQHDNFQEYLAFYNT